MSESRTIELLIEFMFKAGQLYMNISNSLYVSKEEKGSAVAQW